MANRNGSGASALRRTIFSELRLAFEGPSTMSQVRRKGKAEQIMATAVADRTDARLSPLSDTVVVRFAGDSGDGMQLTGGKFTLSTARAGNDIVTFPDFTANDRATQATPLG